MILTPTEQRVMQGLLDGLTNKEIAEALHVSERTIKFHVSSIFKKRRVSTRTELILMRQDVGQVAKDWDKLTDLQKRICRLSMQYSVLDTAKALEIGKSTAWNQQQIAFGILGVKSRIELAAYMGRYGLLDEEAKVIEIPKERKTA